MYWELLSADEKGCSRSALTTAAPEVEGRYKPRTHSIMPAEVITPELPLHQLWPVQVEGRASTLVWRGDMISSASVGSLRGIERIAAESTMIKDISRSRIALSA